MKIDKLLQATKEAELTAIAKVEEEELEKIRKKFRNKRKEMQS